MSFIQFNSPEDKRNAAPILDGARDPLTTLDTLRGDAVCIVPPDIIDELADAGIGFQELPEARLAEVLTPRGLEYLETIRRVDPSLLTFDRPLPPFKHREVTIVVAEALAAEAEAVLARFDTVDLRRDDEPSAVVNLGSLLAGDDDEPVGDMVSLKFFLPADQLETLRQALEEADIIGFARKTIVLWGADPDARPEGGEL